MMGFKGKVSVLMPGFNEGSRIFQNLRETAHIMDGMFHDYEIIFVDDGSVDNTLEEAQRAAEENDRIRIVTYEPNKGKGCALKEGFNRCSGDMVVFLDSDLDLHPGQLERFYSIMKEKDADVVIGSKMHKDSNIRYPAVRRLFSWVYFLFVKLLFGLPVKDTQTGLKMFKYAALSSTFSKIMVKRFAFDIELLASIHRRGFKIVESPVDLAFQREKKLGNMTAGDVVRMLLDTLAVFYRMRIAKYYDRAHKPAEPGSEPEGGHEDRPEEINKGRFEKGSLILFMYMMAGHCFNYLFQFFLVRYLSAYDYGVLNSLMSLFMLFSIPAISINMYVSRETTKLSTYGNKSQIRYLILKVFKTAFYAAVLLWCAFFILRGEFALLLNIKTPSYIAWIGLAIGVSFLYPVFFGVLQGEQRFSEYGLNNALGPAVKLGLGIVVILFSLSLDYIIIFFFLMCLAPLILSAAMTRDNWFPQGAKKDLSPVVLGGIGDIVPTLIFNTCYIVLTNIDMLIVKSFFPSEKAGLYAAVMLFGKANLYFPAALTLAMFPMVTESHHMKTDTFKLLNKTLAYTAAISLLGALVLMLCPQLIITTLFGDKYAEGAYLLKYVGFITIPLALVNIICNYNIAKNNNGFIYNMVILSLIQVLLMFLFNDKLEHILCVIMGMGTLMFLINYTMVCLNEGKVHFTLRKTKPGWVEDK